MRNNLYIISTASLVLALALTFGCAPDIEPLPPADYSSSAEEIGNLSSSSLSVGKVLCSFGGQCLSIPFEDCSAIGGQIVQSCPAASSSSAKASSSSVATVPSSSSVAKISSSSSSLSAGTVLCLYSDGCVSIAPETCSLIGQIVQSCPAVSSSSVVAVPSSSSFVSSSSSAAPIVPSSSSVSLSSSSSISGANYQITCTGNSTFVDCDNGRVTLALGDCVEINVLGYTNKDFLPTVGMRCETQGGSIQQVSVTLALNGTSRTYTGNWSLFVDFPLGKIKIGDNEFGTLCVTALSGVTSVGCRGPESF